MLIPYPPRVLCARRERLGWLRSTGPPGGETEALIRNLSVDKVAEHAGENPSFVAQCEAAGLLESSPKEASASATRDRCAWFACC
jgi:hypothetical protein